MSAPAGEKPAHIVKVIESQMDAERQNAAIEVCIAAVENKTVIREIAAYVKKEYDKRYPSNGKATDGVYHCVCGTHFASAVSHECHGYVHIKVDQLHMIIFKSRDSPFDGEAESI
ncbi:dynein light chain of flagellar outer arm [Chloropicon primus]|uniref:Dynein light chain n=1 Tax=Chloropicon primus TaxID=1764295 RepID=A0A5B8MCB2_9CHLO|nr:dynein light chain of flagellar outer arm [Chloropicon primus]UPQ97238.1 dynein light chain of flagellar outer arm [Chloropicon primus]|eukprot:QDZ18023.1 dynein light chain of flagellar outer arm [Chloropicon primus]